MAATFAPRTSLVPSQVHTNVVPGAYFEDYVNVTGDTSYPAGGYAFGNTQLQTMYGGAYSTLVSVDIVNPWLSSTPTAFNAYYNQATGKIGACAQAVAGAATAQVDVTAATNMSTFTCTIRIRFY
jgi:hypothetical protein